MSTTQQRQEREKAGLHPFHVGLYRLFKKNGYAVYSNDALTGGVIECPPSSGWVDHWIRYAGVKGREMTFAFDAPHRIPRYIKDILAAKVQAKKGA